MTGSPHPWVARHRRGHYFVETPRRPRSVAARAVHALQRVLYLDLERQHRELHTQVWMTYGIDAGHRNQALQWNRWGW